MHPMRSIAFILIAQLVSAAPLKVPGLRDSVEVLVDRWGIPHIYAKNTHDAYFAQGFNAASERLFQMDLWRKRGLGRLSEDLGPAYLAQDRAARLFLYRDEVEAEWRLYTPSLREILQAFTDGINARIAMVERDPALLPWEFRVLKTSPARWQPSDLLVIRSAALSSNGLREVEHAKAACEGKPVTREQLNLPWTPQPPDGLDMCSIPADVLRDFRLGRQTNVVFNRDTVTSPAPPQVESNNWAISARRSETGRAILATDPHRPFSVPAFRYFAHISAPGLNAIGFGEPQHPGFVFGHNDAIAWGQTTFQVDMEDLYVYETDASDRYRYRGEWRPMKVVRERIPVRGGAGREVVLKYTQHGPVIYEEPEKKRAYALRTGWLEPGSATFLGSIGFLGARNWTEFNRELTRYRVPGNNVIYADVRGNVGLASVGNSPRRPNWDGLYPVPGDGTYEWEGIRPNSDMPRTYNPPDGFVASANNTPYFVEPKRLAAMKIGYQFGEDRIARIREVLGKSGKISFSTALALQNDYQSASAVRMGPYLEEMAGQGDSVVQRAVKMLTAWDKVLSRDSAAAALYELWNLELTATRERRLADMPADRRVAMLTESLAKAVQRAEQLLGSDWDKWQWGRLHHLRLEHPLSSLVDAAFRKKIDAGGADAGKGGGSGTVGNLGYDTKTFRITHGNSSRFVIDVGNWDASKFLHVPGQSADPESDEYRNLLESWVREEYQPLLYSREAIEAATVRRVTLVP